MKITDYEMITEAKYATTFAIFFGRLAEWITSIVPLGAHAAKP
jgi:hypothetical protein